LRHPIEFSYMLGGIILDRVDSVNDLGIIMDSKMYFNVFYWAYDVTILKSFGNAGVCEEVVV
jgi:hypothetical protein